MATLKIEKRIRREEIDDYYDSDRHKGYGMIITFPDGSRLDFGYVVPSLYEEDECVDDEFITTDPNIFISSYQNGIRAGFGRIWHSYSPSTPIWTIDGKIGLYLHDTRVKPTLELSPELAHQLINELERIK